MGNVPLRAPKEVHRKRSRDSDLGPVFPEGTKRKPKRTMQLKPLSARAHVPRRAHVDDAGLDVASTEDLTILPGDRSRVHTDIAVAIPADCYGRLSSRSSLASPPTSVDVCGGVIDSGYRGEVQVILHNHGKQPFQVHSGDAIAQLIIERCERPLIQYADELPDGTRGAAGFGSTNPAPEASTSVPSNNP